MDSCLVRRFVLSAAGAVFLVAVAAVAPSGPVVGGQPFTLPTPGQPMPIWNGPAGTRVGVTVSVNANSPASVAVKSITAGVIGNLGQVPPGDSCVFEGNWDVVQVIGLMVPGATGSYVLRAPTIGYPDNDGTVGSGSIVLPSTGGDFAPYGNSGSLVYRIITVQAPGDPVTVTTTTSSNSLLVVGASDWSFCGVDGCPGFRLYGRGSIGFMIYDIKPGGGPCNGNASGAAGETDKVSVDGTMNLSVTVQNTGSSPVMVTSQTQGGQPSQSPIPPGGQMPFTGNLSKLEWTYQGAPGSVSLTVVGG